VISLDTCREILGLETSAEISDEELREVRAQLYGLAEIALDLAAGKGRVCRPEGSDVKRASRESEGDHECGHLHPRLERRSG
jgi:hypothetical protein